MTETKRKVWVVPCTTCGCGCSDEEEDQYELVYELPGVKKEDIHLHVVKNGLRLEAARGEDVEYVSEYQFICEANPEGVKATYDNGLLDIIVPYACPDPFKGSKPVEIE